MEIIYYEINEGMAKLAKSANSFSDYAEGSATQEYKDYVKGVYDIVEKIVEVKPNLAIRAIRMAEQYSRKLAKYYNDYYRNEISCPSIMISGAGNFPVRKKEKQNSRRDTLIKEWEYLKDYAKKIEDLLTMKQAILSNDENAIELLEDKLEKLESTQDMMKAVNTYYRKHKTLDNCPELTLEQIQKLKESMSLNNYYGSKPFLHFELSSNNAKIKTTRCRLENLKKEKESGTQEQENQFFKIVENKELMRLQLVFESKPEQEVMNTLNKNGFRWSYKNNCWQRQLTDNARCSLKRVIQLLEKREETT